MHASGTEKVNGCNSDFDGNGLSMEVSAIYLAMKNSKLECVDEHGQDPMSSEICTEEDEFEDFDDFDPYLFIKTLPDLSSVVPTFRRLLLPKQTRSCPSTTLVLDLDGKKKNTCTFLRGMLTDKVCIRSFCFFFLPFLGFIYYGWFVYLLQKNHASVPFISVLMSSVPMAFSYPFLGYLLLIYC